MAGFLNFGVGAAQQFQGQQEKTREEQRTAERSHLENMLAGQAIQREEERKGAVAALLADPNVPPQLKSFARVAPEKMADELGSFYASQFAQKQMASNLRAYADSLSDPKMKEGLNHLAALEESGTPASVIAGYMKASGLFGKTAIDQYNESRARFYDEQVKMMEKFGSAFHPSAGGDLTAPDTGLPPDAVAP